MKPSTLLWCAAVAAACRNLESAGAVPPSAIEAVRLEEARSLLDRDPDRALAITDEILRANPDSRPARLLASEGSLRLARSGRGGADLFLRDAADGFERALADSHDATDAESWYSLAECRFDLAEFDDGAAAAHSAAEGFAARKTAEGKRRAAEARLLAARCDYRAFAAARAAELDRQDQENREVPIAKETTARATRAAAGFDSVRREFPGEATTQVAAIHQWLGQDAAALGELERGLSAWPQEASIHDAYIRWMTGQGQQEAMVGAYTRLVRENPGVPLVHWFHGRALFARADRLRSEGNFQGAAAAYDKARGKFGEYLAMVAGPDDATNQWLALCDLSACRVAIEMGDLDGATARLLSAAAASPTATAYVDGEPALRDSFGGHFGAAVFAVHRGLADGGTDALPRTLTFNEAVIERCPDRFGFVYNNAALAARDLGVQKATAGDDAAAKELWERSYRHYEKAVELSPDDARIVNDCGLMLVYHLGRDLDRARALFERAISIGQRQLDALPRDADPSDRQSLEEAIGDAYQNIAVLLRDHRREPAAAWQPFCEQAIRYFPHQRREAARMLRDEVADGRVAQGGAAEALAKVLPTVNERAAAQDFDGALTALEGVAQACKDHAPYHALRGDLTLRLARQSRDANRKGTEFHYQDALAALKRAVELDSEPAGPRQLLGEVQLETGDAAAAAATASSLLLHLQSQGGGSADAVSAAHALRAGASARAYAAKKADNVDEKDLLADARASFRHLEGKGALDAALRTLWSTTELWAGAPAEAVNVHARALRSAPDDQQLLAAVVDVAAANKQLPLAVETLQGRTDATGLWYLGRARFLLAGAQREDGKAADALKTLDAAMHAFRESMQKNAEYRDSCEQWLAMCLGKKGNIALRTDDLANAEAWLLDSVRLRPDRVAEDLGLAETTKLGILSVADKHYRKKDLAKVEAIYRTASDAANSDLDLLNNAGLFARDRGNELEQDGKDKDAREMYEQSYKAYRRAQQLDPQNVRLRNDCALIAIYHLERDWELAKELLEGAIADGEKTLKENPPEHAETRQQLDEAVGDCYENLALWHLKHDKDGVAAKAAAQRSQRHWPGERRPGARRHIQAAERLLQGK